MTPTEMLERFNKMNQLLDVIETRFKKDQEEITRLKSFGCELNKNYIRFDDPVVTGLVDVLVLVESHGRNHGSDPLTGEACECESCENYFAINKALSAYEARVKEVGK